MINEVVCEGKYTLQHFVTFPTPTPLEEEHIPGLVSPREHFGLALQYRLAKHFRNSNDRI